MKTSPHPKTFIDIKEQFFRFLMGRVSLKELEVLLYDDYNFPTIKKVIGEDGYLDLVMLNFNQPASKYEAIKILEHRLDMAEYERWWLLDICSAVIDKKEDYPSYIVKLYDLYCKGYYFLQKVALEDGLSLKVPPQYDYQKEWSDLPEAEQYELAEECYPAIVRKVRMIRFFIRLNKLVPTGEVDELGRYQYLDYRTDEEKTWTEYQKK